MRKTIFFFAILIICAFSLRLKNRRHKRKSYETDDNCQDSNIFLIMSRATGYNLSLALRFVGSDGTKYYWTVTNQNTNSIPDSDKWVKCDSGIKNLYSNQYLYIDGARNAVLVDEMETNLQFNTEIYPGYTVIERYGMCLTTQDDGASYFAANYKGVARYEIYQQWNIHYI